MLSNKTNKARIYIFMLYGEFKKRFDHDEEYDEGYRIEDARATENKSNKGKNDKSKPHKKHKAGKIILVIICCIVFLTCSAMLYIDLFTVEGLGGIYDKLFRKNADYLYILSMGEYATMTAAEADADGLKGSGAAGYIHYNGKYNVFLAVYPDINTAEKIAQAGNYTVFPILKSSLSVSSFPTSLQSEAKEALGFQYALLNEMYDIAAKMEAKEIDSKTAAEKITAATTKAKLSTEDYLAEAEGNTNPTAVKYRVAIISALSVAESLQELQQVRPSYLSDLRHASVFIALTFSAL